MIDVHTDRVTQTHTFTSGRERRPEPGRKRRNYTRYIQTDTQTHRHTHSGRERRPEPGRKRRNYTRYIQTDSLQTGSHRHTHFSILVKGEEARTREEEATDYTRYIDRHYTGLFTHRYTHTHT